jgi:hypothetical protein
MPDDNPYAAPQTIGSPRPPLSLAEARDARQLFPEWDTPRVTRLAGYGRALQQMTQLCLGVLIFLGLGLSASWMRAETPERRQLVLLYGTLILVPLALRVWWGIHRAAWMRPCGLFFDALASVLIVFALGWGIWACFRGDIHFGLAVPMLGLAGFLLLHTAASFLAHLQARELFGHDHEGHDQVRLADLGREADYRRRHGIG